MVGIRDDSGAGTDGVNSEVQEIQRGAVESALGTLSQWISPRTANLMARAK